MIRLLHDLSTLSGTEWRAFASVLYADRDRIHPPQSDLLDQARFPDVDYLISWLILSEKEQEARWRTLFASETDRLIIEQADLPVVFAAQQAVQTARIEATKVLVADLQGAVEAAVPVDPIIP